LPAWSVAVQIAVTPSQPQLVAMVTVPSALATQQVSELGGQAQTTVGGVQQSVAVAETTTGVLPQLKWPQKWSTE